MGRHHRRALPDDAAAAAAAAEVVVATAVGEAPVLRAVARDGLFGVWLEQTARKGAAELAFALSRVQRYGSVVGHVPAAGEGAHL